MLTCNIPANNVVFTNRSGGDVPERLDFSVEKISKHPLPGHLISVCGVAILSNISTGWRADV
jgi:hypothetical protein